MVTVAERFRRNTVDVVYVGSNPTSHPKIKVMEKTLRFFKDEIWESRIVAIARDCKSLAFGLQRFESSLSHCSLTMLLKGVTDAQ